MHINETLAFLQQQEVYAVNNRQAKDDKDSSSLGIPGTWGEDKVSFSAEALARAEKMQNGNGGENSSELQPEEFFQAFMDKTKGRTPSQASDEARLKTLEKELANLQNQLAQITADDSLNDSAKEAKVSAINTKITAIMEEISKLDPRSGNEDPSAPEPALEA